MPACRLGHLESVERPAAFSQYKDTARHIAVRCPRRQGRAWKISRAYSRHKIARIEDDVCLWAYSTRQRAKQTQAFPPRKWLALFSGLAYNGDDEPDDVSINIFLQEAWPSHAKPRLITRTPRHLAPLPGGAAEQICEVANLKDFVELRNSCALRIFVVQLVKGTQDAVLHCVPFLAAQLCHIYAQPQINAEQRA